MANNVSHPQGPARGFNSTCIGMSPEGSFAPADCHPGPRGDHWWGGYEDSLFEQHVLAVRRPELRVVCLVVDEQDEQKPP